MDGDRCERGVDAWDRYARVWDAALYVLLGTTLVLALLDPATAGDRWLLAGLHPVYLSLLLVLYPQVFRFLRLPLAIPAAVALTDQSYEHRRLIERLEATRCELAAAERERGRLAERQRLARDIHDTLAQGFVSIVLQLQAAEAELPEGAAEARRHLERARRTTAENLAEARRLVWDLRPAPLRAAPLGEALGRLAACRGDRAGPAADGNGAGGGLGLPGIRERVEALGGRLAVETAPGRGTTIAVTVPTQ